MISNKLVNFLGNLILMQMSIQNVSKSVDNLHQEVKTRHLQH